MDLETAFKILEVNENSKLSEIKQAYRDLIAIWHPDRHTGNARLQKIAEEKTKQLNAAYDYIRLHLKTPKASGSKYDTVVVSCRSCGMKNRLPSNYDQQLLRCGKCGAHLFGSTFCESERDWEKRILCPDPSCIGIIGAGGICSNCGKTPEEARTYAGFKQNLETEEAKKNVEKHRTSRKRKTAPYIAVGIVVGILLVLADQSEKPNEESAKAKPPTMTSSPSPLANRPLVISFKPGPRIAGSSTKTPIGEETCFTKEFFFNSDLDRASIEVIQRNLLDLGYAVGMPDGLIGDRTLTVIKRFSKDFDIAPTTAFASELIPLTTYHAIIARAHPDWRILYTAEDVKTWILSKPPQFERKVQQSLASGDPSRVISLLNWYKFDKERPPPLNLPKNGIIRKTFMEGIAPLKITTKHSNQHHYIKLVRFKVKTEIATAFVKGGTSLEFDVPLGNYELRCAVGEVWYGDTHLFGPNTRYSKADTILDFKVVENQVLGHEVQLFLQPHGNLTTSELSAFDF
jgi:hypothetical protein